LLENGKGALFRVVENSTEGEFRRFAKIIFQSTIRFPEVEFLDRKEFRSQLVYNSCSKSDKNKDEKIYLKVNMLS
jgi:hypothetical protein